MESVKNGEQAVMIGSGNGIEVFYLPGRRFKTNMINLFFLDNLDRTTAALNAIVPAILRRGTRSLPTMQDIALRLEDLYGASFDCGVYKKGECQIVQFYIEYVSDMFAGDGNGLSEKAFELLLEILTKPVLEDGMFKPDYVEQEKENLKKLIASRSNDKVQYAVDKCLEEMCDGEPYAQYEYGSIEDVEQIDGLSLYAHYQRVLRTLPMKIYFSGNFSEEMLKGFAERLAQLPRGEMSIVQKGFLKKDPEAVRRMTERMNINQGKLCLGFRTNTAPDEEAYYSLMLYNSILGGGVHSKLFQNVREKENLAYYAFSRLDKFKGLMVISSGIEIANHDKALEIIQEQMEDMRSGRITDTEFEAARKAIENGIRSMKDSQLQMVDFSLGQSIAGTEDSFDQLIEKVMRVSRAQVTDVSKRVKPELEYFLTSN